MKKTQRKKELQVMPALKSQKKRPVEKEPVPVSINLGAIRTTYLKKGSRWLTIDNLNSLDGFQVESYIPAANVLFLTKQS